MAGGNTTLKVTIIGDSKNAQKAFDGLSESSGGLVKKMGGFGGFIAKGMGAAGLAIGAAGVMGAKMGIQVAAGNEQATIAFTTMLGSAQKAGAFIKDLQQFAAKTPFEFDGLQQSASTLISAGIEANKVIPIMTTLGNVTSGMGTGAEGVQRATVALQQMNAAGKISGEDLNQLRDAGIPVYDLLASATGKSKAEVVKLAQAGKLGQKELGQMMSALESGKGLERFAGLMDKQSASLSGLWSTFHDTMGQGLAKAMEPALPILKSALNSASTVMSKFFDKTSAAISGVMAIFQKGDFTKEFGKAFNLEEDSKVVGFLFAVRDGAKAAKQAVSEFIAGLSLKSAGDIGAPLEGFVAVGFKVRSMATKVFGYLKTAIPPIVAAAKDLWPPLRDIAKQLLSVTGSMGLSTWGLFKMLINSLPAILRALTPGFKDIAKWMGEHKTLIGAVATIIVTATTAWKAYKVIQTIVTTYTKAYAAAQLFLNAAMSANPIGLVIVVLAALAAGLVYAYKNSETFRNICQAAFKAVGQAIQFLWEHWWRPVIQLILHAISGVANGFANFLDMLSHVPGFGWAKDAATKIRGAASAVDALNSKMDNIDVYKEIDIVTKYSYPGYSAALSAHNDNVMARHGHDKGFAVGTNSAPEGWAWVGEKGPELMYIPGGSKILTHEDSKQAIAQGAHSARKAAQGGSRRASGTGGGGDVFVASGGAPSVTVHVTVQGSVMTDKDLAATLTPAIRDELVKIGKRNGNRIFPASMK